MRGKSLVLTGMILFYAAGCAGPLTHKKEDGVHVMQYAGAGQKTKDFLAKLIPDLNPKAYYIILENPTFDFEEGKTRVERMMQYSSHEPFVDVKIRPSSLTITDAVQGENDSLAVSVIYNIDNVLVPSNNQDRLKDIFKKFPSDKYDLTFIVEVEKPKDSSTFLTAKEITRIILHVK
jgi:hypothetical protein